MRRHHPLFIFSVYQQFNFHKLSRHTVCIVNLIALLRGARFLRRYNLQYIISVPDVFQLTILRESFERTLIINIKTFSRV